MGPICKDQARAGAHRYRCTSISALWPYSFCLQDAWISAIVSCVPQGTAAQQTSPPTSPRDRERAPSSPPIPSTLSPVGSFIGGRSPAVTAVAGTDLSASRASGSGSGPKAPPEPLRDAFRHLLVDERGYVQILNTIVTVRTRSLASRVCVGYIVCEWRVRAAV